MKTITKFVFIFCSLLFAGNSYAQLKVKGIVVYIDFSDTPAWVTPARLDSLFNGVTYSELGAERSVRAYWRQQSRGKIDFTHDIFFYRAPRKRSYYNTLQWYDGVEMMMGALTWIAKNNPDMDWYSYTLSDNTKIPNGLDDGFIQSVHFILSDDIPGSGGTHMKEWTAPNEYKTQKLEAITLHSWWDPTPVNISPICHEMGHSIFGVPDTYDNDGSSDGTGVYSLMSAGAPDAEPFGAPFLAQFNWVKVIKPSGGTQRIKLIADGDSVVKYADPKNPAEFFTIEARKKSTIGNSLLSTDIGLIIWHTDNLVTTSNTLEDMTLKKHYRHSIEQADGKFDLERNNTNRGDAGDMYVPGTSFTNTTTPNSKWWKNTESGLSVINIAINGNEVSFDLQTPDLITSTVEPQKKDAELKVYPNPTTGLLYIKIPEGVTGTVDISVLNTVEVEVLSKSINTKGNSTVELDLSGLSKGLYTVCLKSNSNTNKCIKIIVE